MFNVICRGAGVLVSLTCFKGFVLQKFEKKKMLKICTFTSGSCTVCTRFKGAFSALEIMAASSKSFPYLTNFQRGLYLGLGIDMITQAACGHLLDHMAVHL